MPSFFGLDHNYIESVYEEIFVLKYHGHWSFAEAYTLPINIRRWFIKRLVQQKEREAELSKGPSRAPPTR